MYSIVDGDASPKNVSVTSRPWIRADASFYTVALASILARMTRDAMMQQAAWDFYKKNANNSHIAVDDNTSSRASSIYNDDDDESNNKNNDKNHNFVRVDDYYGFYSHGGYPSRRISGHSVITTHAFFTKNPASPFIDLLLDNQFNGGGGDNDDDDGRQAK
jgi:hypothetical protein